MTVSTTRHRKGDTFHSNLSFKNIVGRSYWWRLDADLIYESKRLNDTVIVPAGTETNLASIPRPLWAIWPPHSERYSASATVHDYLYKHNAVRPNGKHVSRRQADLTFRDALKAEGVPLFERNAFYFAVRLGGRGAYKRAQV